MYIADFLLSYVQDLHKLAHIHTNTLHHCYVQYMWISRKYFHKYSLKVLRGTCVRKLGACTSQHLTCISFGTSAGASVCVSESPVMFTAPQISTRTPVLEQFYFAFEQERNINNLDFRLVTKRLAFWKSGLPPFTLCVCLFLFVCLLIFVSLVIPMHTYMCTTIISLYHITIEIF